MSDATQCEIRSWRNLGRSQKSKILKTLSDDDLLQLEFNTVTGGPTVNGKPTPWWVTARTDQLPPLGRSWSFWVILAGRGFGKTRSGAEFIRNKFDSKQWGLAALVAKDPSEARDVMIEGPAGIMNCVPPHEAGWAKKFRPKYEPSKKQLTWPLTGGIAKIYSSEDPEELRGPQHEGAWVDEIAKFRYIEDMWTNLLFGLRMGVNPQAVLTTTPRPVKVLKQILKDPLTVVTRGKTYDNLANLSPVYQAIIRKYEGTRLGRQELDAELLEDNPHALWTLSMIDEYRIRELPRNVKLTRVAVGIDPSAKDTGNEAGIIVAGLGSDLRFYVLEDRTLQGRPEAWAAVAVAAYKTWNGDRICVEVNNGGQMCEAVILAIDRTIPVALLTATRNKITRAEPISALYERGLVSHVGTFPELEDEMTSYAPIFASGTDSPNRMDALVWCLTFLGGNGVVDLDDIRLQSVDGQRETLRAFPLDGVDRERVAEDILGGGSFEDSSTTQFEDMNL